MVASSSARGGSLQQCKGLFDCVMEEEERRLCVVTGDVVHENKRRTVCHCNV